MNTRKTCIGCKYVGNILGVKRCPMCSRYYDSKTELEDLKDMQAIKRKNKVKSTRNLSGRTSNRASWFW